MPRYDEKLGAMEYDNLINSNDFPIITGTRTLRKGQGVLTRGTALAFSMDSAGDSTLVVLGTTAVADETLYPNSILCDDVDTGTTTNVTAEVYTAGHFNLNKLTTKSSHKITVGEIEEFRTAGIYLDNAML